MSSPRAHGRPPAGRNRPTEILLALDGSTGADTACTLVSRVAWPAGSRVRVVTALGGLGNRLPTVASPAAVLALDAAVRGGLATLQADARDRLEAAGLLVESRLAGGRAADVILEAEREIGTDVVVVGSRGLGPVESLLLGSTGMEVVARARSTVLVARRDTVSRAVLALDASTMARRAEQLVAGWPMFRGVPVTVVAVEAHDAGEATRSAVQVAAGAAMRLRAAGVDTSAAVQEGDPAGRILEVAADAGADIIVLGARGMGRPGRGGIGGVARNVVTAGPSVLLVRRPRGGAA